MSRNVRTSLNIILERVSKEVGAEKRRGEAIAQSKGRGRCPERYYIYGLLVQAKTVHPEGVDFVEYDIIGQDETNVLHFEPQHLWVEKTITPVLRRKGHRDFLSSETVQAHRPHRVIGGGHVGANLLATLVDNMYNHHLPEYRQVKMFAERGQISTYPLTLYTVSLACLIHRN